MPSQQLKAAIDGDEIAFIQMLWLIEHQKIEPKDLKYLQETLDKKARGRCLTAALYIYGAPGIDQGKMKDNLGISEINFDPKKPKKLLNPIIAESNFPYATYLKYKLLDLMINLMDNRHNKNIHPRAYFTDYDKIYEEREMLFLKELKQKNPLLMLEAIKPALIDKFMSNVSSPTHNHLFIEHMKLLIDTLKKLPATQKLIQSTGFSSDLNTSIKYLTDKMTEMYSLYQEAYMHTSSFFSNTPNWEILKDYPPKDLFSNIWVTLVAYHRNTGQRTLMFHALQQAVKIDPKQEETWLKELGGEDLQFSKIEKYLNSFLEIAKVILNKIPTTSDDEALENVRFKQAIEFSNCKLLAEHFSQKLPLKQASEINKLFDKCEKINSTIERDIKQKISFEHKKSLKNI